MKRKIDVRSGYERVLLPFSKSPKYVGIPKVSVILKSPSTLNETEFSKSFLLDTGASISVVNSIYEDFIGELEEIDRLNIRYGAGSVKLLPVFKVIFVIKGYEVLSTVAYDPDIPYQILGHFDFLENFTYTLFDSSLKESRLIKI